LFSSLTSDVKVLNVNSSELMYRMSGIRSKGRGYISLSIPRNLLNTVTLGMCNCVKKPL